MTEAVSEIAGYLRLVLYTKKNPELVKIYSGFFLLKLKLFLLEPRNEMIRGVSICSNLIIYAFRSKGWI